MENANRALIMAAEVLVGLMIISIAVYLFQTFASYSAETNEKVEQAIIDEFNNNFLKFQGSEEVTIHDIVTLTKLADEYNTNKFNLESTSWGDNTRYIKIFFGVKEIQKYDEEKLVDLISENALNLDDTDNPQIQYYKVVDVTFNLLNYVNSIKFVAI